MRSLFVFSALALCGCVDNALPVETSGSSTSSTTAGSTTAGTTTAGTTTAGTTTAGTTTAGSTTAGSTTAGSTTAGTTTAGTTTSGTAGTSAGSSGSGGQGAMCDSACDCMAGLACFNGMCVNGLMGITIYCCDDPMSCPGGQVCQSSAGMFSMCGNNNGTTTTTGMGGTCKTACDCPTGLACFQGGCVPVPTGQKLYCCDDANSCPSGGFCQSSTGNLGSCPGGGGTAGNNGGNNGNNGGTNGGGPRDAGTGPICQLTKCMTNMDCQNAGCGTCNRRGTCNN